MIMYFQYEILIFKRTKSKEKGLILKQANKQTKKNNNKKNLKDAYDKKK